MVSSRANLAITPVLDSQEADRTLGHWTKVRNALGALAHRAAEWMEAAGQPTQAEIKLFQEAAAQAGAFEFGGSLYDDGCNSDYVERAKYVLASLPAAELSRPDLRVVA